MTGLAINHRMRAGQRKAASGVNIQHILSTFPTVRRVAALAIDPEFAFVHIAVAIRAFRADLGKFGRFVATHAFGELMPANQGKAGFHMFEIQRLPHFRPGIRGVATDAIPFDFSVGIFHIILRPQNSAEKQEKCR